MVKSHVIVYTVVKVKGMSSCLHFSERPSESNRPASGVYKQVWIRVDLICFQQNLFILCKWFYSCGKQKVPLHNNVIVGNLSKPERNRCRL